MKASVSPIQFADTVLNRVAPRAATASSNRVPGFWLSEVVISKHCSTTIVAPAIVAITVIRAGRSVVATAVIVLRRGDAPRAQKRRCCEQDQRKFLHRRLPQVELSHDSPKSCSHVDECRQNKMRRSGVKRVAGMAARKAAVKNRNMRWDHRVPSPQRPSRSEISAC